MKIIILVFMLFIIQSNNAVASDSFKLKQINKADFEKLEAVVRKVIKNDNNNDLTDFFEREQSFDVLLNNAIKFRLIPGSYASAKSLNGICALFVFSKNNHLLETLPLHCIQGDRDEVVASCIGVQAVALEQINNTDYLIYLLSEGVGSYYGDAVFIASIRSDKISKDEALTACVSNNKDIGSIGKIRKAMKKCLSKSALPGKI